MHRSKLLIFIFVGLALSTSTGCAKRFYCCPPTNTLLTQSEAESISGIGMGLAYDVRDSTRSSRSYTGRIGNDICSVWLNIHRFGEKDGPSNEAAHREVAAKYGNVENITGVGDSSFLSALDDGELHLYARKGNIGLQLHAKSVFSPNEARERLIAVARLVAARLA